jgi:hypothetical protein
VLGFGLISLEYFVIGPAKPIHSMVATGIPTILPPNRTARIIAVWRVARMGERHLKSGKFGQIEWDPNFNLGLERAKWGSKAVHKQSAMSVHPLLHSSDHVDWNGKFANCFQRVSRHFPLLWAY